MARSYSYSRIECFNSCPRQYKFQYIEKAVIEKPVGVELFLGSAVHHSLEKIYQLKMNGKLQSLEDVLKGYHEYWEGPDREHIKVTREQLGVDDYIKSGADILKKYYDKYSPFEDSDVLALEKNIYFPIDGSGKFTLSGKIDRISRRKQDGVIEIVDYKTKMTIPAQRSLSDDDQMGLYQAGVKYLWPDFDRIELKQIFLRQGIEMSAVMDDDKLEEIKYRAYQKILDIERAAGSDNFPPKESALCDWCLYYELCPAKRHKLAIDKEITDDFDAISGEQLAEEYLELNLKKKQIQTHLDALKEDIVSYCEENDLAGLEAPHGSVKITISEVESFPSKNESEDDYLEISYMARQAGLEECFKLDQNILYKEFYAKERLPENLADKLKNFLRMKKSSRITANYKEK